MRPYRLPVNFTRLPNWPLDRVVETLLSHCHSVGSLSAWFEAAPKLDGGDPLPVTPRLVERVAP